MKPYQKIEPIYHRILRKLLFVSRLNIIWVINVCNIENVTFQDKTICMENARPCLWQKTRACNLYNKVLVDYLNIYKYAFTILISNFI